MKAFFYLPKASLPDVIETHWTRQRSQTVERRDWFRYKYFRVWTYNRQITYKGSAFFVVVLFLLPTSGNPQLLLFCWPPSPLRWQPSTHTHTVWLSQTATPPQFQYLGFFQQVPWLSIGSWNGQRIFAGWPATINWLCCGSVGILNLYSQHSIPALSDDMNKLLFSGARPRCNRTWGMDFARLASLV